MGCFFSKSEEQYKSSDVGATAQGGAIQQQPAKKPAQADALGDTVFGEIKTLEEGEALRAKAHKAADEAHKLGADSKAAYSAGDGAKAKELSNQSKALWEQHRTANAAAADIIFAVKNQGRGQWSIDLHLLLVAEAEARTKRRLKSCVAAAGDLPNHVGDLVIIYGAGHHSAGGVQKIKPAILKLLGELQFREIRDEWDAAENRANIGCVSVRVPAGHPMHVFAEAAHGGA